MVFAPRVDTHTTMMFYLAYCLLSCGPPFFCRSFALLCIDCVAYYLFSLLALCCVCECVLILFFSFWCLFLASWLLLHGMFFNSPCYWRAVTASTCSHLLCVDVGSMKAHTVSLFIFVCSSNPLSGESWCKRGAILRSCCSL